MCIALYKFFLLNPSVNFKKSQIIFFMINRSHYYFMPSTSIQKFNKLSLVIIN